LLHNPDVKVEGEVICGYARVSAQDQVLDGQIAELKAAATDGVALPRVSVLTKTT
jgi:hypothetical protein